jgi:hypothetical protein
MLQLRLFKAASLTLADSASMARYFAARRPDILA